MTAVSTPYVLDRGESRWEAEFGGARMAMLARTEETAGQLLLFDYVLPPGLGPPLHRHADVDEALYVIEGTFAVRLDGDERQVDAGAFVWMPRGAAHAFANAGDAPARVLGLATPSEPMEAFFVSMTEVISGSDEPPDPETLMELNTRHGIEVLGPPLLAPDDGQEEGNR